MYDITGVDITEFRVEYDEEEDDESKHLGYALKGVQLIRCIIS